MTYTPVRLSICIPKPHIGTLKSPTVYKCACVTLKSNALARVQKIHNYWKNIFLKGPIYSA